MRCNEEKTRGFFSHGRNRVLSRFGIWARSILATVLVRWLDDWQAVLQLAALLFFFACALPMGITYLGIWYGGIYGYAWAFLWIGVSGLLAYREVLRRDKAMTAGEWTTNPNALEEYLALVKKD